MTTTPEREALAAEAKRLAGRYATHHRETYRHISSSSLPWVSLCAAIDALAAGGVQPDSVQVPRSLLSRLVKEAGSRTLQDADAINEARALYAATPPAAPAGMALVPLRLTREMERVMEAEDWQWADLLAAADAVDLTQYEEAAAPAAASDEREPAPPNHLPDWDECALRVENSDFIAKRVAEGGYGPEHDSKLATQLHRFIYEYDDADPYRSAWFLHRLELLLDETKRDALAARAPQAAASQDAEIARLRSAIRAVAHESHSATAGILDLHIIDGETTPAAATQPTAQAEAVTADARLDALIERHLPTYWQYGAAEQDRLRTLVRTAVGEPSGESK